LLADLLKIDSAEKVALKRHVGKIYALKCPTTNDRDTVKVF